MKAIVTVIVTLNAESDEQARERVRKAVICLENSLRYADPRIVVSE